MTTDFAPLNIREMIAHDAALERYPLLSAQILNRWVKSKAIRRFRGKDGVTWYFEPDLSKALGEDMQWPENEDNSEGYSNTEANGSGKSQAEPVSTATGTMTEADALREKLFLRSISTKPKKKSSPSLVPMSHPPERQQRSGSSMS